MLYPIKFKPILKDVIWGGTRLRNVLGKANASDTCGESWEISAIQGKISVVDNGFLKGNNLQEIIEIYMGELLGDHIYEKYGLEFPLLIKFLDANDLLSIQVHPDDELAKERHNAYGKTEMWYIIATEENAKLISGFTKPISKEIYLEHFKNITLPDILNYENVKPGDVFFIPAGRVHAIGSGILLAEIQQTSDITTVYMTGTDWIKKVKEGSSIQNWR
jgi:mannose-6-phosphate isomerase